MSERKTVQRRVRPITIRCGAPGCATKPQDAAVEEREDGTCEVLGPKGWVFPKSASGASDVFVGKCPAHGAS